MSETVGVETKNNAKQREFIAQIIADYKLANVSRECSL